MTVIVIVFVSRASLSRIYEVNYGEKQKKVKTNVVEEFRNFELKIIWIKLRKIRLLRQNLWREKRKEKKIRNFIFFFCFISELPEFENVYRTVPVATY